MLNLIEIFKNHGLVATIVSIFLMGGFVIFSAYIRQCFISKKKTPKTVSLKSHSFFNNTKFKITIDIPNMDICPDKPNREKLFKEILTILFEEYYKGLLEFVEKDNNRLSQEKWTYEFNKLIYEILDEFSYKCERRDIPRIIVDKFMKWQNSYIQKIFDYLNNISKSRIYDNNDTKLAAMLLMLELIMTVMLAESERTLKEVNGEISGLEFDNTILE